MTKNKSKGAQFTETIKINFSKLFISFAVMILMFSIAYYFNLSFVAILGIIAIIIGLALSLY
jgi:small-conductance mechanosensitive channel